LGVIAGGIIHAVNKDGVTVHPRVLIGWFGTITPFTIWHTSLDSHVSFIT
jgi:hypothetical protein